MHTVEWFWNENSLSITPWAAFLRNGPSNTQGAFPLTLKVKLRTKNTPNGNMSPIYPTSFFLCSHEAVFQATGRNGSASFLAFRGHMIRLSVGIGSLGHDIAGAARGPAASNNPSKVERVSLKFWIRRPCVKIADYHLREIPHVWPLPHVIGLSFQHSSHNTLKLPSISNNDSECGCWNGNKPAEVNLANFRTPTNTFLGKT